MSISIFKRKYKLKRYEEQKLIDGYASSKYTILTVKLDVQPITPDDLQALPEGERTVKRIKSFGDGKLVSADDVTGIPGDRLYYNGSWYECVSSNMWDHTILSHYESQFTLCPADEQEGAP